MNRLILMRHGTAERRAPSGVDFDRRLTAHGRADAELIGRALARAGFSPDVALVSAAQRARQTWAAAEPAFDSPRVEEMRALYSATPQSLLAAAEEADGATVMVVAHNPTLHDLAVGLLNQGRAPSALTARIAAKFPPATAVVFAFEDGAPQFEGVFYAGELGGGGRE